MTIIISILFPYVWADKIPNSLPMPYETIVPSCCDDAVLIQKQSVILSKDLANPGPVMGRDIARAFLSFELSRVNSSFDFFSTKMYTVYKRILR